MRSFPHYRQHDTMDCGPTCLRMIAKYYGKQFSLNSLRNISGISKEGVSLLGIGEAATKIGFRTIGVQLTMEQLLNEVTEPCIIHWDQNHFVVFIGQRHFLQRRSGKVKIADPRKESVVTLKKEALTKYWLSNNEGGEQLGTALLLEPTSDFYNVDEAVNEKSNGSQRYSFGMISRYLWMHKNLLWQLVIGLIAGSVLQVIFPFLTQSIVDVGIATRNLSFITIILIAQLMLFFSRTVIEFIRSRILLYISTRINMNILSDFWIKLMKLPLSFFDTKMTGDIMQRLGDHHRIENFLTGTILNTLFSLLNLIVFSVVLLLYDYRIFLIYLVSTLLYYGWIKIFLRIRRRLDYQSFAISSKANSETMELIQGMQEIKLNTSEQLHRWKWENLQAGIFKVSFKKLSINQYQQAGTFFINEGKNIFITFMVAEAVVNGQLTLGAMLAIQYIIGQLNSPIEQLLGFVQTGQDAKISLERLNEIHQLKDEETFVADAPGEFTGAINTLPANKTIYIENLSFSYNGAGNEPVLKKLNLEIPQGKVTAIVGMSGSGKTTILKLLLKFYDTYTGDLKVGSSNIKYISPQFWRRQCGAVMQDGYIFNNSIAKNIAVSDELPDYHRLIHAARVANILSFVESLPLGFNTKIGAEGNGISVGQRQRILIARVVYKNPEYIFFDEATNALDANNERAIMDNLQTFFKDKTVVIVAHRLSTVKNADNIIVLENGLICEEGNHNQLASLKGKYFELVKNQLELGS
ncbi:MAG: peptidase domain-containing ABC transporter [Ferruginibacter sp.]